jgi:hypothetical protein
VKGSVVRRLRPIVLGAVAIAALAATGCGEKSEPAVHPPTTVATPATTTTATPGATTTQPQGTQTAPAQKTTP